MAVAPSLILASPSCDPLMHWHKLSVLFSQAGRAFSARVADFGLSRSMGLSECIATQTMGTITHMPPELIREGRMSLAADVYAFGVIVWCVTIWCGGRETLSHGCCQGC
jgi:serine/threonine protein kinase